MLCKVAIVGCYTTHIITRYVWLLLLCTHIVSATPFFKKTSNIAQENTTVDILTENQLWTPLDMVVDQEQEVHKPNG